MKTDAITSLWDAIHHGGVREIADRLRVYPSVPQADESPSSPDRQHGRKSALCGAQHELSGEDSQAGSGTAGAGSSHGVHMDEQHNKLVAYVLDFPEEAANTIAELRQKRAEHERLIDQLKELLEADYPMHALDLVRAEFEEIHGPKN